MMNRLNDSFANQEPAQLVYEDGSYRVVRNGSFVVCAVTGQRIPLNDLKYWSVERQEPYADAAASLKRHLQLKSEGEN